MIGHGICDCIGGVYHLPRTVDTFDPTVVLFEGALIVRGHTRLLW